MANVANTPMLLTPDSQTGLLNFHNQAVVLSSKLWNMRYQLEKSDRAYMREMDKTDNQAKAALSNAYGDPTKFQNITVPVVLPQVEGAVVYQSSVFLTGNPIFESVADPQFEDAALQHNTLVADQQIRGGWVAQIMQHFRNGAKYNLAAMEIDWKREVSSVLETDLAKSSQAIPKETIWEGNCLKNLDLYNTYWDTRVNPVDVPKKGEFAGYTELMSRVALKAFLQSLPYNTNVKEAFESAPGGAGTTYYTPILNPNAFINDKNAYNSGGMDWQAWVTASKAETKIEYKNMYEVSTEYVRIIPSDFKIRVPSAGTPQVWKVIIVNHSVIVYAERQTNAHNLIPILFSQPNADGLGHQTKSLAENTLPMQSLASALWNANIAARRRAISDRGIYDPSKIDSKHINSDAPNAKIPVRPSAYGKPVSDSYYPIPFRDDQAGTIMQESGAITAMANMVSGQNQVRQGQFVKGNKTQSEFDTVMGNANGRDQITSMLYESQLFTPLKEIIKLNNLQYQGGTSLYNRDTSQIVEIDPIKLRQAVIAFKMSDGLLPTDKLINADTFRAAVQTMATSPQLGAGYNLAPAFSYMMKTQGVDLKPFEKSAEQQAYEQGVGAWQQAIAAALKQGAQPTQLPPQPKPADYGWVPSNTPGPTQAATVPQGQSLLDTVSAAAQASAPQAAQSATTSQQPTQQSTPTGG